jgi:hypothetical protein
MARPYLKPEEFPWRCALDQCEPRLVEEDQNADSGYIDVVFDDVTNCQNVDRIDQQPDAVPAAHDG